MSIKIIAAISPPDRTKSPIESSSISLYSRNLSSIPSYLPQIIVISSKSAKFLTISELIGFPPGDKNIVFFFNF